MKKNHLTRREFLVRTVGLAGAASLGTLPIAWSAPTRKFHASDQVVLGKTGIRCSLLGFGTGTHGGRDQRSLGYEEFTRLIRYAYDHGITYIDTAQNYRTHEYVRRAIQGLPREKLFIQTKIPGVPADPLATIDRYRKELNTDYIDSLLAHVATSPRWDEQRKRTIEAMLEAKERKWVRALGVSCHSLPALRRAIELDWVEIHLVRINPKGVLMDTETPRWNARSDESSVPIVVDLLKKIHEKNRGVIGMKILGEGRFQSRKDRADSIRFVLGLGTVQAMVIGFKSKEEIDEAIQNIEQAHLGET